ncbi:Ureidoglycolate hydrolase [Sulfitobacter noctilucicola]|uniref:Ureidoglycolate lyase n=1 Tax=Sulfitobacter noctilucicola TaxID=1342301 RepID=A0A7W6Q2Q7_9RHOB|nr:ureidoglycolate lyase [Sulfitobacter noctilucicola]KIN63191.1 Ureidoglycolate hydrolase [Sulfitobacter noctilucicola]MBB4172284.1 ureidoglycolate lyase [Sulfitobacter noctilucicola]
MSREITIEPLTPDAFAPFGDVLDASGQPDKIINAGLCGRHHDLAQMDFGQGGRAGISIFNAQARSLPYAVTLLERHPDGSQAFLPLTANPFLVIVAPDNAGEPGVPRAFITAPHQGINFYRSVWHGVLTPLSAPGLFAVVDRIGDTPNLEEVLLDPPYLIVPSTSEP